MKRNFLKMGIAATLTFTGIAVVLPQKIVSGATLKTPIKRIQINYLPGKNVKIWTNFEGGQLITFGAKNKSKWNVAETAVDRKGKLWYKIGENEWIEARYTEDLKNGTSTNSSPEQVEPAISKKKQNEAKQTKKQKETGNVIKQIVLNQAVKPNINKTLSKEKTSKQVPKQLAAVISPVATGNVSQLAQAVVDMAKSLVGKGYAWGGNGPDTYDCSGLVKSIYSKVGGVNLPRVTTDQVKVGTTVLMDQLQPADLLYWGSADAPYHIGIYIGNNQFVHASTPEKGVVLQTISSYFYPCIAKRVLQ